MKLPGRGGAGGGGDGGAASDPLAGGVGVDVTGSGGAIGGDATGGGATGGATAGAAGCGAIGGGVSGPDPSGADAKPNIAVKLPVAGPAVGGGPGGATLGVPWRAGAGTASFRASRFGGAEGGVAMLPDIA